MLLIPYRSSLVFFKQNTSQLVAYLPLKTGDTFQITWKHSIHLTDVVEKYRIMDNNDIMQYEIVFEHYGIGMPSYAQEGETFSYSDGKYHIKNMKNKFSFLNVRNGKIISEHRLVWGDHDEHMIWFNEYFERGGLYTIKMEKLSLWQLLKGVKIRD